MTYYPDHTRIAQTLLDKQAEINELRATVARVREVAEDIGTWGLPNDQARQYSASLLAALDGDTPKEPTA